MSTGEDLRTLYNERIMALADDIPLTERLEKPDATASVRSPLCGSRITVDLDVEDHRVVDYGHTVKACALGRAAASIMARHVIGKDFDELQHVVRSLRAMLKQGKPLPEDVWDDIRLLEPVRDYKSRHGSVMLAFDAVEKALDEIEARSTTK